MKALDETDQADINGSPDPAATLNNLQIMRQHCSSIHYRTWQKKQTRKQTTPR